MATQAHSPRPPCPCAATVSQGQLPLLAASSFLFDRDVLLRGSFTAAADFVFPIGVPTVSWHDEDDEEAVDSRPVFTHDAAQTPLQEEDDLWLT